MLIYEITFPGTWLDCPDRDWTDQTQKILRSLRTRFYEANVALNLFIRALAQPGESEEQRQSDFQRRREIQDEMAAATGSNMTGLNMNGEQRSEASYQADIRSKREKWSEGRIPRAFLVLESLIYARAFLFAFCAFERELAVLADDPIAPPKLRTEHDKLLAHFANLRGVRDTARTPGNLLGTRYGGAMADGNYAEVDVTADSIERLQRTFQAVLDAYKWTGPKDHHPG